MSRAKAILNFRYYYGQAILTCANCWVFKFQRSTTTALISDNSSGIDSYYSTTLKKKIAFNRDAARGRSAPGIQFFRIFLTSGRSQGYENGTPNRQCSQFRPKVLRRSSPASKLSQCSFTVPAFGGAFNMLSFLHNIEMSVEPSYIVSVESRIV